MSWLFIQVITFYQKYISPLFPPTCIYHPTCSTYMIQAIKKHGAFRGLLMGIARILRCHPYTKGGDDPVPDYFTLKRNPSVNK